MQLKRYYSAREASALLGYKSANPVLAAVRDGRLTSERTRGASRSGRNTTSLRISGDAIREFAAQEGIDLDAEPAPATTEPEATAPEPAAKSNSTEPETFNAGRVIPLRPAEPAVTAVGLVTIPIEHYAALVTALAELDFLHRNFELIWKGKERATAAVAESEHTISIDTGGEQKPRRGRAAR